MSEADRPAGEQLRLKCGRCGHVWPVLRLPVEVSRKSAPWRALLGACCPNCNAGTKELYVLPTENTATTEDKR
jgi:hypothetical protein